MAAAALGLWQGAWPLQAPCRERGCLISWLGPPAPCRDRRHVWQRCGSTWVPAKTASFKSLGVRLGADTLVSDDASAMHIWRWGAEGGAATLVSWGVL